MLILATCLWTTLIKEAIQVAIKSKRENLEVCYFEDLVASMPIRLKAVIEAKVGPTKW